MNASSMYKLGLQASPSELSFIFPSVRPIPTNILITTSNLILEETPKTAANLKHIGKKFHQQSF